MKKIIKFFFALLGFKIISNKKSRGISFHNDLNHRIGYEYENEANASIKVVRKNTMLPYINLLTLYEQVIYCEKNNIDGDFVECGVWKGGAVGLMAMANLAHGTQRRYIHLFDAFDDICSPNEDVDGDRAVNEVRNYLKNKNPLKGELKPVIGIYDRFGGAGSILECKELLEKKIKYPGKKIHYHKGWFQEVLPIKANEIDRISILRLDGDWYESTKVCLEHLYDKVVPNGIIIFDDYGLYAGCKKAVDDFLISRNESFYLHYSSWACRYIQKK